VTEYNTELYTDGMNSGREINEILGRQVSGGRGYKLNNPLKQ
jgi:hypothetical protein